MVTRRTFRRIMPMVCAVILLRIYVIRFQEDSGDEEDSGIHKWHQFISSEAKIEEKNPNVHSSSSKSYIEIDDEILLERRIYLDNHTAQNQNKESIGSETSSSQSHKPVWTRITDDLYTYSGFWDSRPHLSEGPVARVLGIMRYRKKLMQPGKGFLLSPWVKENMLNHSCFLWYKDTHTPSPGIMKAFVYEEGVKEYTGTFFLCHPVTKSKDNVFDTLNLNVTTDKDKENVPYAVTFLPNDNSSTSFNVVYLKNEMDTLHVEKSSAVCVRPLFGPYDDIEGIAQFLSYYLSVLKVNNFYFYDLAISDKVREYLSKVSELGVKVNILPWNVPTTDWEKLWDLGSLTALNDCVYRSSGQHAYVAVVDLDEFIVPKFSAFSLREVYKKVVAHKRGEQGDAVLIRNVFFCYEFEKNKDMKNNTELPIFKYTIRESRIWASKQRSKMIIIPETILSLGHHMIHHFTEDHLKNHGAPNSIAVLHHYRSCKNLNLGVHATGPRVLDQEFSKDASIKRFKKSIMESRALQLYYQFINHRL